MHLIAGKLPRSLFFSLAAILFLLVPTREAFSQEIVDELYFDGRGTFHQDIDTDGWGSQFQGDWLAVNLKGHITDNLSYRVRQRFTKQVYDRENFLNATDFLFIKWQVNPKLAFTFGKQPVSIGGFEYDAAPIDVYYWSLFCLGLYQYYSFGATSHWYFKENQELLFELCNSPLSRNISNIYAYNLEWIGQFSPKWKTLWSVNMIDNEYSNMMNYIMLGNRFLLGDLALDIDIMNRASFHQKNFFFSDWGGVVKAIYTVGKWNLCTKVAYDYNSIDNVTPEGIAWDLALKPGSDYVTMGAGIEYFPLPERDKLRLHAVWYTDNMTKIQNFDVGVTWKMNIISSKK